MSFQDGFLPNFDVKYFFGIFSLTQMSFQDGFLPNGETFDI